MGGKTWFYDVAMHLDEGGFTALDAEGNVLASHNQAEGGDQLILDVMDIELLDDFDVIALISQYIEKAFGLLLEYISVTVLLDGEYHDRGFVYRETGGFFELVLDHEFQEIGDLPNQEEAPLDYEEKINDDEYLETIADLEPQAFVEELGLNWEEVSARFIQVNAGWASEERTFRWIRECVLFGDARQRDIQNYAASPRREALVRTTLSEDDLVIIIATRQSLAYIKSREVVEKGELFVWEDLRGNRKIRGTYSSSEAWTNRTALKEGHLDKQSMEYLLIMQNGIGNIELVRKVMEAFTINAGYEEFTYLIKDTQSAIEGETVDGIADQEFVDKLKQLLYIGNEADAIAIAYVTFMYLYGGIQVYDIKAGADWEYNLPENNAPLDALRVDKQYTGTNIHDFDQPRDHRNQRALNQIRELIRYLLPEYRDREDDDPALKRMVDQVYARASKLAVKDWETDVKSQVEDSKLSLVDRIDGLQTYLRDIEIKQLRQMVEEYTGSDRDRVYAHYQLWGEVYATLLIEKAKLENQLSSENDLFATGLFAPLANDGPIMEKINRLALYLKVGIPGFEEAQATQAEIWKKREMLQGSPTGYDGSLDYLDQPRLDMAQAVMYGMGINKYFGILHVLFQAFHRQLSWSQHISASSRDRLEQDKLQQAHLDHLLDLEAYYDQVVPIPNYVFIKSSYEAELEAANLDHVNRSNGFALPIFSAQEKGAPAGAPRVLIIFSRPDKYNLIEKSTLKASLETAESRNLIPPGMLHFELGGRWYDLESDHDWQWSEILAIIGIGLAIVAAIAAAPFTGGATAVAVPYLTAAAIGAGVASSIFSIKEKSEIGELTAGVAVFEIGLIIASVIPFLGTGSRILRGAVVLDELGALGKMSSFVLSPSVQRLGSGLGLVMTSAGAIMFADTLMTQLDAIADMESGPEKEAALRDLIRFAALTGLMLFVSARADFKVLKGNPKLSLHASVKAEYNTQQRIKNYNARIRGVYARYNRANAIIPGAEIIVVSAQYAELIYYGLRKALASLSTAGDRSLIKAALKNDPEIKKLGLTGDKFDEAYKLAEQVDTHLATHPTSKYQGKEDELFRLLMQGKRRFNAEGKLVVASPERVREKSKVHENQLPIEETSTVYRTQGGIPPNASHHRVRVDENGKIEILGEEKLYITIDDLTHQVYFYNKRGGKAAQAEIVSFKIPKTFYEEIKMNAVTQRQLSIVKKNVKHKGEYNEYRSKHPEISDPTKSKGAYGLYGEFLEKLEKYAIPGTFKIEMP